MGSWFMPSHALLDETFTFDPAAPISVTYAALAGSSPLVFGSVTLVSADTEETLSCRVQVYGTAPYLKDHVRVRQRGTDLALGCGGLSLLDTLRFHRVQMDMTLRIPTSATSLALATGPLSARIQSAHMPLGLLSVETGHGSTLAVSHVTAKCLTLATAAGALTFVEQGEVTVSQTLTATTTSGHLMARGALYTPGIQLKAKSSGALDVQISTSATEILLETRSGHLGAVLTFTEAAGKVCTSKFNTRSGAMQVKLQRWSGLILAESKSGAVHVRGKNVHKSVPGTGWRLGVEDAKVICTSSSGAITVEASA